MHRNLLIRLVLVLVAMLAMGSADLLLPAAEAAHRHEALPMACDCGDRCSCTGDMSCCTDGAGTCGMSDSEQPADEPATAFRPLPPVLLSLGHPWWRAAATPFPTTRMSTYRSPFGVPPDPPPWRLG